MTARILTKSDAQYSAERSTVWALSQSLAHVLITQSPAHTYYQRSKPFTRATGAMEQGTLLHSLVLGKGAEQLEILDVDAYRSNAAKEARDNAIAQGLTPIKRKDYDGLMGALSTIHANIKAAGVSLEGEREVAFEWEEEGAQGPVICRGKMDLVRPDVGEIVELKKTVCAHPRDVAKAAYNYGMDLQYVAYVSAMEKYRPEFQGRVRYQLVFIEMEPPYAVLAPPLSGAFREMGERRWGQAIKLWEQCLATNTWPGYDAAVALEPTSWMLAEAMGSGE